MSVKAFFKYLDENERKKLNNSTCLFTISVGQQSHEGERFEATMELINRSFSSSIMLIDDSLQRHNMALNQKEDAEYFYNISVQEGDLWLERNEEYYKKCKNLKKIVRWDYWLNHPDYKKQHEKLKTALKGDNNYLTAFEHSIDEFLSKYTKRLTESNNYQIDRAKKLCLDFILEECTALTLWPELNAKYEAYPGIHNKAIEETRKRFVPNSIIRPITIGFRNAGQMEPQKFILLR
jgi:hypothetical protein